MKICQVEDCSKPGTRGGLCQMHAWRLKHHGTPLYEPWPTRLCSYPGCGRKHKKHGLCSLHANRQKRGVPLDYVAPVLAKKRYRLKRRPEHPLADIRGRILEHRMVLFGQIGFLAVPCFWCGVRLQFGVNLFVDHLDFDRHNNVPMNLVPACNGCNAGRTRSNPRVRQSMYSAA